MKESEINFNISLDEDKVPEKIVWAAPDGGVIGAESSAIMLNVWDDKKKESLKINLWTKEMPVDNMKIFFHQTFVGMAESYLEATGEEELSDEIIRFAEYFADRSGIKG